MSKPEVNVLVGGPINGVAPCQYKTKILKANLPFKDQVEGEGNENTKFVIKWDFDLGGETVTMPENCILEFDGGSVTNGSIISNKTILVGDCKSSNNSLFGLFYDQNGNYLGWDKNKIGNWNTSLVFGTFRSCIEPGENFGGNQSMVMDEDYFYLLFSDNYTENDEIYGLVTIVMYDRNFNYIGYSSLSRPSHANGATMYNDKIYIACNGARKNGDSIHVVDIEELRGNCIANKGKASNDISIKTTNVAPISLGYVVNSIDYDPITNTFAVGREGKTYMICDTSFNVIKSSTIGDYRDVGREQFGRTTTQQDFVYQNGILYILDWDYNHYRVEDWDYDAPYTGDGASRSSVIYIIDVATDTVIDSQPVTSCFAHNENEGLCKDPITGLLYASYNIAQWYCEEDAFSVCSLSYNNKKVDNLNRQIINDNRWFSGANASFVCIDNTYTGISCGTERYPYKSLGEALVMAPAIDGRMEFFLMYTGIPYYLGGKIKFSDVCMRISTFATGPNGEYPEIDGTIKFRASKVSISSIKFNPSGKHNDRDAILEFDQHCDAMLTNLTFTNTEVSKCKNAIAVTYHCYLFINNITFSDANDINYHIVVGGNRNTIVVRRVTVLNGTLINMGSLDYSISNTLIVDALKDDGKIWPALEGNSLLVKPSDRIPGPRRFARPVESTEDLDMIMSFFISPDETRTLEPFAISFFIAYTLLDSAGNTYKIGWYTNDILDGVPVIRSLDDTEIRNGVSSCLNFSTLPQNGGNTSRGLYVKENNIPVWWSGSEWKEADGKAAGGYNANGVNLIKNSEDALLRSDSTPMLDCIWRRTINTSNNPPSIVDANPTLLPDVKKGFYFNNVGDVFRNIAYEIPYAAGPYTVSCWVKGTGSLALQINSDQSYEKGVTINSPDSYVFAYATFDIPSGASNEIMSVTVGAGSDTSITICAIKCEKGWKPTLWKLDKKYGETSDRPTQASVGEQYFDASLGKPIYVKEIDTSTSPATIIWVDALGNDPDQQ